jgi:Domain of unknown function (DUF4276)
VNRLRILVEGEAEEDFVNEVLAPHLLTSHDIATTATGISETKGGRGIVGWRTALRHIRNSLREDSELYVTTLVDYYALPMSWPGRSDAARLHYSKRAAFMASKISEAVAAEMGDGWRRQRFIPNVLIHEFETLLFSDPSSTARAIGNAVLETRMNEVLQPFESPEQINDHKETCPSQRLVKIFVAENLGKYEKPIHGNIAILEIGFETLQSKCPQFGAWLESLEKIASTLD